MDATERFLGWVYSKAVEKGLYLCIWTLPDKKARFFNDTSKASAYVNQIKGNEKVQVYVGVSAYKTVPQGNSRGGLSFCSALITLWADIDFGNSGVHKKPNIPPSMGDALKVLKDVGAEPSVLVHSGHGLQAWWILEVPFVFETEADRVEAAKIARDWVGTLQACARKYGWTLDSVGDLPRVFRVPGTLNRKTEDVEVRILRPHGDQKLEIFKLENLTKLILPTELLPETRQESAVNFADTDPILPHLENSILTKVKILCENDRQFKTTWERKRTDMNDQSPSGYDMALASLMARIECSDQEIADTLYEWRKLHEEDSQKLFRRDYLMRTINRARTNVEALSALDQIPAEIGAPGGNNLTQEKRDKIIGYINKGLGIKIEKVVKHGRDNSIYSFELTDGRSIHIGNIAALLSTERVREVVADTTGVVFGEFKRKTWRDTASYMLSIADTVETEEFTVEGQMMVWIQSYLDMYFAPSLTKEDQREMFDIISGNLPFSMEGNAFVSAHHLRQHIRMEYWDKFTQKELCERLRQCGFKSTKRSARFRKRIVTRGYWVIGPRPQLRLGGSVEEFEGKEDGQENANHKNSNEAAASV